MTDPVETHLYVLLDEDGNPARAYRSREQASEAVNSESYADDHLVEIWPDVPLIESQGGEAE